MKTDKTELQITVVSMHTETVKHDDSVTIKRSINNSRIPLTELPELLQFMESLEDDIEPDESRGTGIEVVLYGIVHYPTGSDGVYTKEEIENESVRQVDMLRLKQEEVISSAGVASE